MTMLNKREVNRKAAVYRRSRRFTSLAITALVAIFGFGSPFAVASAGVPVITGPVTGGNGAHLDAQGSPIAHMSTSFDLASKGYVEEEFFIGGNASAYTTSSALSLDGVWNGVSPLPNSVPYQTRMRVIRPLNPRNFNGTVIVEWVNVSSSISPDVAPVWAYSHDELLRKGYAYVAVTAQYYGVYFLTNAWEPGASGRYFALEHPGDSYSYDIFSQAGQALRTPNGPDPLGNLRHRFRHLIATGQSQSSDRLTIYYNAIQPLAQVYDGFLIVSRPSLPGSPLSQTTTGLASPVGGLPSGLPNIPAPGSPIAFPPTGTQFRVDLNTPVLAIFSESELAERVYGYASLGARQADSDNYRAWEVGGGTHFNQYVFDATNAERARSQVPVPLVAACDQPRNSGPFNYVVSAGVFQINEWVNTGKPAPSATRLSTADNWISGVSDRLFNLDGIGDRGGNALGGVRTPQLDVPTGTYRGVRGPTNSQAGCVNLGSTYAFPQTTLDELYPNHWDYAVKFARATTQAVLKGFILPADGLQMIFDAAFSQVGKH